MELGYDLQNPPYVYDRSAQWQLYPGNTNAQNGEDAVKNLQYIVQNIMLYNNGGEWLVDLFDGNGGTVITGGYYDPLFPVRAFAVAATDESTTFRLIYDTPFSTVVDFPFSTGLRHPEQITRVWTGNTNLTAGKILLSR